MPYIGKPQSADPITVNSSNITDGTIVNADLSSSLTASISGAFTETSSSLALRLTDATGSINNISGSNSTRTTTLEAASSSLASDVVTLKGGGTLQSVATNASPTFVGATITGTLTAQEVHTEFESASILFSSGSTKFGDSGDDIHNMTGSLRVSGSAANESFFLGHNVGIGTNNPGAILDVDSGAIGESDSEACGIRVTLQRNGSAQGLTLRHEDASGGSTDASEGTSIQFQGYDGSNSYHNLAAIFGRADGESVSDSDSPGFLTFHTTPDGSDSFSERMRITKAGYVGIGTDNPEGPFHVHSPDGANYGGYTMTVKNLEDTANRGNTLYVYGGNNSVQDAVLRVDTRTQGTALACLGTGAVGVGLTGPNVPFHVRKAGNGKAGNIARFAQENDSDSVLMYGRGSGAYGASSADACMAVATMETTGRSINAGGTINASGADYAEYETKRDDCGTIEKGDIVGFDTNGLITDKWTNAVTFGIKSTNPSYVGGDTWGVGVSSGSIETERQKVDRIAYSGKVPCNVTGSNVGDYIIPIQVGDGIGGVAKSSPTYDEYKQSVGVVRTISGSLPIVVVKTL